MIKMNNIKKYYNINKDNECRALDDVNLEIEKGELLAIMGKSGSGKSTLLHILGCLDNEYSGEYYLDNISISLLKETKLASIRNRKIGIVLQEFLLIDNISAYENVVLPLYFSDAKIENKKEKAIRLLKGVDLGKKIYEKVINLSGGEKQRVAIARALIAEPNLILADEPTGSLDVHNAKNILDTLIRINKTGKTIVIVTHETEIANKCNRIIELEDGKIISDIRKGKNGL